MLLLVVFGTAIIPVAWWWWHAVIGAGLFTAAWVGRVHPRAIAWRLVGLAPFVAGAALAAAWHGEAGPGWRAVVTGLDSVSVEAGARVADGQVLGRAAEDGEVYFELRRADRPIDPRPFLD